jgi:MtN3 and saliva related transmembrane protein
VALIGASTLFYWIEAIGACAALITTLGWVPQVVKLARERKADDISLAATSAIAAGVALWAVYGVLIGSWPVIIANILTLLFVGAIVLMKLRFG